MSWTLDGTRIFVQKISEGTGAVIAKLQPLSAGTVYQSFGYETNKVKLGGLVVGRADLLALKGLTEHGDTAYALVAPEGALGNFFVSSVNGEREKVIDQTIRPDLSCDSPVYTVDIELLESV